MRRGFGADEVQKDAVMKELLDIADKILPYAKPVWKELARLHSEGKRILFEGAQGVMLDVDHGTYAFVTSSNTVSGQAATGSGLGPAAVDYVLGIAKAYTTRVGNGPFPTELFDEVGQGLGERGHEFGTVTGRQRRCGWFDAALVRKSVSVNGANGIALTKLDVLDGMDELNVCVGYKLNGKEIDYMPSAKEQQADIEPIYETMEGWSESTEGARRWADLPANAIKYVGRASGQKPFIKISAKEDGEGELCLTIANSLGDPLQSNQAADLESTGLGTKLMTAFCRQLEGEVTQEEGDDTFTLQLRF